jgi:mitogen-activated protein kinase 1/3
MENRSQKETSQKNNSKNEKTRDKSQERTSDKQTNNKSDKPSAWSKTKHSFVVAGTTFTVDERYELIKQIGLGAYGVVCACFDKKTNMKVAIKKVPNAFDDLVDAKRILREIKLLKYFDHENIVSLLDVPKPEARTGFNDIYIVTDLMETDLHRVIYSRQVN